MSLKKLFLCHYSGDAVVVRDLALSLRLHGIVPWIDKNGGFAIADECEREARRAIRNDCFGLLLYATEHVFERPFIRDVEMKQAVETLETDSSFMLFAVPSGISFDQLEKRSLCCFGLNLSRFHSIDISASTSANMCHDKIASMVLNKIIGQDLEYVTRVSLQYSTRDLMPDEIDDLLCIDARSEFEESTRNPLGWSRLTDALADIKYAITGMYGRPRLYVHGSKHLTAAFIFGRVFAPFEMDIRQSKEQIWSTDCRPGDDAPMQLQIETIPGGDHTLFVEIASAGKNVSLGVDSLIAQTEISPSLRLKLRPRNETRKWDNACCQAAVEQTYSSIEYALQDVPVAELHLFAAAPQAFMIMLGRTFRGLPPVHLYEWTGQGYEPSAYVPAGVL